MTQISEAQAPVVCPRCGETNSSLARFCQQCGYRLLGPAGAKGAPSTPGAPAAGQPPTSQPQQPAPAPTPWTGAALGGLAGLLIGSLFGGGRGGFGGWGDNDDWGGCGGGDFSGGGDSGGGGDS